MATPEERVLRLKDSIIRIRDAATDTVTSKRDKDWPYDAKKAMAEIYGLAVDALLLRTLMYLYEATGNAAMKANVQADYERAMFTLQKRHGSIRPARK